MLLATLTESKHIEENMSKRQTSFNLEWTKAVETPFMAPALSVAVIFTLAVRRDLLLEDMREQRSIKVTDPAGISSLNILFQEGTLPLDNKISAAELFTMS